MASDRLSVRIPEKLRGDLQALVDASGKSEAVVVRQALEEYCRKHARLPTAYDVAKEAGAIGCVKGGPKDRSTNPKYLRGMGHG